MDTFELSPSIDPELHKVLNALDVNYAKFEFLDADKAVKINGEDERGRRRSSRAAYALQESRMVNVISHAMKERLCNQTVGIGLIAVFLIGFSVGYRKGYREGWLLGHDTSLYERSDATLMAVKQAKMIWCEQARI
jgi:hypothetical protein